MFSQGKPSLRINTGEEDASSETLVLLRQRIAFLENLVISNAKRDNQVIETQHEQILALQKSQEQIKQKSAESGNLVIRNSVHDGKIIKAQHEKIQALEQANQALQKAQGELPQQVAALKREVCNLRQQIKASIRTSVGIFSTPSTTDNSQQTDAPSNDTAESKVAP